MYDEKKLKILFELNTRYVTNKKVKVHRRFTKDILRRVATKFNNKTKSLTKINIDTITDETTYDELLNQIDQTSKQNILIFEEYFGKQNAKSNAISYLIQILKSQTKNKVFTDQSEDFHTHIVNCITSKYNISKDTIELTTEDSFLNALNNESIIKKSCGCYRRGG